MSASGDPMIVQAVNLQIEENAEECSIHINEVMFFPEDGGTEWVELKNCCSFSMDIRGYSLTDEDDNWYRFPCSLPFVPPGAFVVVMFDGAGAGSNDYDFSDNVVVLHSGSGLIDIFDDNADQVSLYGLGLHRR
jgi:hypothetical protein